MSKNAPAKKAPAKKAPAKKTTPPPSEKPEEQAAPADSEALAARVAELEKELADVKEKRSLLQADLEGTRDDFAKLSKERDALKSDLETLTTERDNIAKVIEESAEPLAPIASADAAVSHLDGLLKGRHFVCGEDGMVALKSERYAQTIQKVESLADLLTWCNDQAIAEALAQEEAEAEAEAASKETDEGDKDA